MIKTLYEEKVGSAAYGYRNYRVLERPAGTIEIWCDLPAGESNGWPECSYSGDLSGARKWWRKNIKERKEQEND